MTYLENKNRYRLLLILSFIALFLVIIISSMVGVADITFVDGAKIILNRIILLDRLISLDGIKHNYITIVWDIRFPRILLSALIGCGLSVSGAAFQGMFKNPMADPYVLGVSSGAALGATIGIVLGFQSSLLGLGSITIMAFIGAITTMIVVYHIAKIGGKVPVITLLLAGISISYLLSSVISIMMIFNKSQLDKIVFWIMGSVSAASWTHVKMLAPITLIVTFFVIFFAKDLNIMLMGEDTASSLGIEVEKVKKILLLLCSIVVAATVSVGGIIGFVGLIVPHTVRMVVGPDYKHLVPFSAVLGAIFMIISDTLARTLMSPAEIPVGAITSLFGAPYFIYLLIKSKKKVTN